MKVIFGEYFDNYFVETSYDIIYIDNSIPVGFGIQSALFEKRHQELIDSGWTYSGLNYYIKNIITMIYSSYLTKKG